MSAGCHGDEKIFGDLEMLCSKARELGASDARPIEARKIVVKNWVRFKCWFGCGGYGERLTCPPYSPDSRRKPERL